MFRLIVIALFSLGQGALMARQFELSRDTFAFANDTVFAYGIDEQGKLKISAKEKKPDFAHGCFLMVRGILQFWKFARFVPDQPRLSREEYAKKVAAVFRTPAWSPCRDRIEFPGFADLRAFSAAYEGLLKEKMGNWLGTYIRPGNWRLMLGHPRFGQKLTAQWMVDRLKAGEVPAVYMARFPWMNHAVIILNSRPLSNGDVDFDVYDVNYPSAPAKLRYVEARRSFDFEKRWYFPGGQVNLMRIYISPFH